MNVVGTNKMRRTVFTIHVDCKVGVVTFKSNHPSNEGSVKFSSERELRKLAADWPGPRLVEIWNQLPGVRKVTRFTDRDTAIRRIWTAVQDLVTRNNALVAHRLEGATKAERIIALLKSPSGATLRAIMDLTGWQANSVRGFISAQLAKRRGFKVQSFKRNRERIYRILP
jgi:hypothetical protein